MTDDEPDGPVNVVDRVTDTHYIVENCVVCGETHRHGSANYYLADDDYAHRGAHCSGSMDGYYLTTDETTTWEVDVDERGQGGRE